MLFKVFVFGCFCVLIWPLHKIWRKLSCNFIILVVDVIVGSGCGQLFWSVESLPFPECFEYSCWLPVAGQYDWYNPSYFPLDLLLALLFCMTSWFLGGLSLHLNHLVASRMRNFDWTFGTLPFGLIGSNLDTMDLETYPRTHSGHFWHMSLFDNSRAVWVLFRKWVSSKNRILLRNGWPTPGYSVLVLGGQVPRLHHGPIWFPIQNM